MAAGSLEPTAETTRRSAVTMHSKNSTQSPPPEISARLQSPPLACLVNPSRGPCRPTRQTCRFPHIRSDSPQLPLSRLLDFHSSKGGKNRYGDCELRNRTLGVSPLCHGKLTGRTFDPSEVTTRSVGVCD